MTTFISPITTSTFSSSWTSLKTKQTHLMRKQQCVWKRNMDLRRKVCTRHWKTFQKRRGACRPHWKSAGTADTWAVRSLCFYISILNHVYNSYVTPMPNWNPHMEKNAQLPHVPKTGLAYLSYQIISDRQSDRIPLNLYCLMWLHIHTRTTAH